MLAEWRRRKTIVIRRRGKICHTDGLMMEKQCGINGRGYSSEETASDGEEEEEMGATMDPPVALGPDIMMKILESSDACSVARRTLVSLRWHEIAASDFLWAQKCEELFKGKAHSVKTSSLFYITLHSNTSLSLILFGLASRRRTFVIMFGNFIFNCSRILAEP
ncbi:unnamed protein product [Musa acuminata subsp. malaccensis]|uniref:(wild Malaysian banana) hypothetical protein n=1 Tax=Musa acuminata subsp. malaccensis TaxID=214687 RepID=A0A8D7BA18_MUSAM|nr:unnamed protein product [Musa acuminata subsp. malaccensis]